MIYLMNRIPVIHLPEGFDEEEVFSRVLYYRDELCGALLLSEESVSDEGHERAIHFMKRLNEQVDFWLYVCGNVRRFEDIKKYLYAGARTVFCNPASNEEQAAYEDGRSRFDELKLDLYDILAHTEKAGDEELVTDGVLFSQEVFMPSFMWDDIKKNEDGLVPVIAQDYRTGEVLMLAYMNEEAYYETIETRQMMYYSRSRKEQWVKGRTSGHFQYLRSMYLDCDHDTILAKVQQIGAACHTGSYSCFFNQVCKRDDDVVNPHEVLESVMATILDRREHPKKGSYTNYLFDKGIDKILKKCGEEATEIVIAAKNPDKEEVKYEIADFLYHMMVLMAERGVTWDDVLTELANR